ncbi:neuroglobin-like [Liolophura sinensis]|uniref:neuroglobin-like n=1 Tax=Liolophura sinensis TaxID=3198878 RepID=UPI0031582F39
MGNQQLTCATKPAEGSIDDCLTERQVHLVQETWAVLRSDLAGNGVVIFTRFFKTNPDMKTLFPKIVSINEENQLEYVIDQKMLQKHATTVLEGLGAAVESLDDPYVLDNVLKALGQTHARRQIKPIMLKRLWPSLDYGLKEVLKEKYSKETAEAWRTVFDYICLRMKEGHARSK